MPDADPADARRLLVDGMNVVGASPDGWWRDREGAMRTLVADLEAYCAVSGQTSVVVFDGRVRPTVEQAARRSGGMVSVGFAPGGPDAADDEIVRLAEVDPDPAGLVVVSSDVSLAARVRKSGVRVIGAGGFRRRVERASRDRRNGPGRPSQVRGATGSRLSRSPAPAHPEETRRCPRPPDRT